MRTIQSARYLGSGEPDIIEYDFIDTRQHRKRIYYDNELYIVEFGFTLEDEGKTLVSVWKSGKKFLISVKGEDILGTKFHSTWRPLTVLKYKDKVEEPNREAFKRGWNDQRAQLFDWIIHPCLPLMRSLAPSVQKYWETLHDFMHCPTYELRIVADPVTRHLEIVQTSPLRDDTAMYDYSPKASESLGEIPADIPRYSARDIVIDAFNSEGDLFQCHSRVRLQDGRICFFLGGQSAAHDMDTDEIRDESLNAIRAFFQIYQTSNKSGFSYPSAIPKVLGIVTDSAQNAQNHRKFKTKELVAGILLTWIPEAKPLHDVAQEVSSVERKKVWKRTILDTITALHKAGIAIGGEDSYDEEAEWSYINNKNVLVDAQREVWIRMSNPVFAVAIADPALDEYLLNDPEAAGEYYDARSFDIAVRMDLKAVERLFLEGEEERRAVDSRL